MASPSAIPSTWVTRSIRSPPRSPARSAIAGLNFASYLNAMEQAGVMRTLAEPSLTAISGKAAEFSVGGEYRLPNSQEIDNDGAITRSSETVEYGIALNFTPVVLGPGRISLDIETSVSEPSFDGSVVNGNGNRVPARPIWRCASAWPRPASSFPLAAPSSSAAWCRTISARPCRALPGHLQDPCFRHAVPLQGLRAQRDRARDHRHSLPGQAGRPQRHLAPGRQFRSDRRYFGLLPRHR